MTLHEAIFLRRSARKLDQAALDGKTLNQILKSAVEADSLVGQSASFELANLSDVSGSSAPYNLLAFCEDTDASYANVGYMLQNADLYIQSIGLGSVWLASGRPKKSRSGYAILLAFGKTQVPQRSGEKDFNRLAAETVSNEANAIAEAARLAPSAMNSQPWRFEFAEGKAIIRYAPRGPMQVIPYVRKLNKIDIGIATRHAVVALRNEGREIISASPMSSGKDFSIEIAYR
jgi:hypothetical protein